MEWLKFLKQINANVAPDLQIHMVLDNYATYKHLRVLKWLAKRAHHQPRVGKRDKHEHRKGGGLVRQYAPLQLGGIGNVNFYAALFDRLLLRLLLAVWQSRVIDLTARRLDAADGCIRATTATGSGLAHCRSKPRCRSGWRPWL